MCERLVYISVLFSTVADNYKGYTTGFPTLPSVDQKLRQANLYRHFATFLQTDV